MSASLAYHTQGIVEFQHHSLWLSPKTEQPNLLCRSKHFSGRGRIVVRGKGRIENPIRSTAQTGKDHITVSGWDLGILAFREHDQCLYGRFQQQGKDNASTGIWIRS